MTLSEYSQLKHQIILASAATRRDDVINRLKELFKENINSTRRFEQINTVGQLLKVLELRDLLSEDDVSPLKDIAWKLNNTDLVRKITEYKKSPDPKDKTYFATEMISKVSTNGGYSNPVPFSQMSQKKKDRIVETVIEEIGTDWRNLGRNLSIREGQIDDIENSCNTMSKKAFKMLEIFFNSKTDPHRWFFTLLQALEQTRRKDLVRSLQEIVTMDL